MMMMILKQIVRPKPHQSHCQAQADNRPAQTPDQIIAFIVTIIVRTFVTILVTTFVTITMMAIILTTIVTIIAKTGKIIAIFVKIKVQLWFIKFFISVHEDLYSVCKAFKG